MWLTWKQLFNDETVNFCFNKDAEWNDLVLRQNAGDGWMLLDIISFMNCQFGMSAFQYNFDPFRNLIQAAVTF